MNSYTVSAGGRTVSTKGSHVGIAVSRAVTRLKNMGMKFPIGEEVVLTVKRERAPKPEPRPEGCNCGHMPHRRWCVVSLKGVAEDAVSPLGH